MAVVLVLVVDINTINTINTNNTIINTTIKIIINTESILTLNSWGKRFLLVGGWLLMLIS